MKPKERLKEIEEYINPLTGRLFPPTSEVEWLINRVHRLTNALEYYSNDKNFKWKYKVDPTGSHVELDITNDIARKALEDE